jgi:peptide/nickel transport system ATP-binding protein
MLEADNLWFRYPSGNRYILDGVSLTLGRGECVGVSAPSGFGKTTLCKILAGYAEPEKGTVLLDGKPLAAYRGYSPVQMIWQHPELALNPRLKMAESLREAGVLDGHDALLDRLGVRREWLSRYPGELSGGELQRFCIARALGENTAYLLADEISAMLDLVTQAEIWRFLREEAAARNIGVLVVSHSEPLLGVLCDRRVEIAGV